MWKCQHSLQSVIHWCKELMIDPMREKIPTGFHPLLLHIRESTRRLWGQATYQPSHTRTLREDEILKLFESFLAVFPSLRSHHLELNFSKDCHEINPTWAKCNDSSCKLLSQTADVILLINKPKISRFMKVQKSKYIQIIKSKHGLFCPREAN